MITSREPDRRRQRGGGVRLLPAAVPALANGGLWTVVSPAGAPLPNARPSGATTGPPAGPSY